jgi:hypothetical protein
MNTQGKYALLYRGGLRTEFRDKLDRHDPEYSQILRTDNVSEPEISASIFVGISRMFELGDGEAPVFEAPKLGPKVMAVDKEFGVGVEISKRTLDDDKYGKMKEAVRWLAHAANMTKEYRVAAFLDDAFTGSVYKGIDEKPLCANNHQYFNTSGTQSNIPTQAVQLSMAGFSALMDTFMTLKDHNGDPLKMWPNKLIIGNNTGDWHRALQIFSSQKEPFTGDNQDNAMKMTLPGMGKPIISRFKSSLKSYFMVDSNYSDAWFLTHEAPVVTDTEDWKTKAKLWQCRQRFLIWFVDWRGWSGANPT